MHVMPMPSIREENTPIQAASAIMWPKVISLGEPGNS